MTRFGRLRRGAAEARPTCIIADTVKGQGVSFMENQVLWHYRAPQGEEYVAAMRELGIDVGGTRCVKRSSAH